MPSPSDQLTPHRRDSARDGGYEDDGSGTAVGRLV
ncbi:hypothetical protein SAZ_07185 [Streptomyces noursei ZPM]|nr:hypothetical protein SAZ_07185 [Streptomyces noursei ZPM]EPY93730.1 hypothetical protein K530_46735 [Streptomyces noursei CCRC 11814]